MSFIEMNDNKVWFERLGSGPNVVLLIPGPIGTSRSDFNDLLDSEDEFDFDKFTVIAVDPPGQGRSRPPQKQYGLNVYKNDMNAYHQIMNDLGYDKYSVIGWSEGAKVALLMATEFPQSIESLVLVGISCQLSTKAVNYMISNKTFDKWSKTTRENYLKVYENKEDIQKLWNRFVNFIQFYNQYFPEDIFKNRYNLVECPVLIVHGDKDPIVSVDEVLSLQKRIPISSVHRFPNGEHDCHQKYGYVFSKLAQDHIAKRHEVKDINNNDNNGLLKQVGQFMGLYE